MPGCMHPHPKYPDIAVPGIESGSIVTRIKALPKDQGVLECLYLYYFTFTRLFIARTFASFFPFRSYFARYVKFGTGQWFCRWMTSSTLKSVDQQCIK